MLDTDEKIAASVIEGHNVVRSTRAVVKTCQLLVGKADHRVEEAVALKARTQAAVAASLALLQRER